MAARYFALMSGLAYVLVGVLGFIPGLVGQPYAAPELAVGAGFGYLFGLFPINVLHNLVHLGVGIWGLVASPKYESAQTYSRGLTVFYGLLTVMGLVPVLNTTFGLIPIFGHDVWLHAVTALLAGIVGFAVPNNPAAKVEDRIAAGTGTHGHQ